MSIAVSRLPNTVYLFYTPPNDILSSNESSYWLWNTLENIGRIGLMVSLCIVVNTSAQYKNRCADAIAVCSLIGYYVLWAAYFIGVFNGISLVSMAVLPSIFFLLISWRQRNLFALIFSSIFAAVHITVTSYNFMILL